jgi:hypothetical protein
MPRGIETNFNRGRSSTFRAKQKVKGCGMAAMWHKEAPNEVLANSKIKVRVGELGTPFK